MRAIVGAIAGSAAGVFPTASDCVAPASTKKSAAREGWAIVSVTERSVGKPILAPSDAANQVSVTTAASRSDVLVMMRLRK